MRKNAVIIFSALLAVFFLASASPAQQAGTTLIAEKTAVGKCYRIYEWEISKEVTPTSITQYVGETTNANYTVTVTKTGYTDQYCVEGIITVTNGGAVATENLTLADRVQYKTGGGQFIDLPGATQIITPAQLAPQETKQYQYKICFEPIPNAQYRNVVHVTITNHSGHLGVPFGPEPKADFSLPTQCIPVNDTIHVTDTNLLNNQWQTNQSTSWQYVLPFTCEQAGGFNHPNTACIVETQQCANANVQVTCMTTTTTTTITTTTTPQTTTTTMPDYTWTIGYWKNHPQAFANCLPVWLGTNGPKSIKVSSAQIAINVLKMKTYCNPSNGITKLYAQLLAAKFNICKGAVPPQNIASVISDADSFLKTHGCDSWGGLSKQQQKMILNWMKSLDMWNNS